MTRHPSSNIPQKESLFHLRILLYCLVGAALVALLWMTPLLGHALEGLDRDFQDRLSRVKGGEVDPDLMFLGIDEKSLSLSSLSEEEIAVDENLTRMKGRFPWDRRVYAEALTRLFDAGAEKVIIDLLFTEPSDDPAADEEFARVLAQYRDRVVLAGAFSPQSAHELTYVEPLPEFCGSLTSGARIGSVNFWPHPEDGIVRGGSYQTTLRELRGESAHPDEERILSLAGAALTGSIPEGEKRILFSRLGRASYPAKSFHEVFTGDLEVFRDKIVIIGPAAERFHDQHLTPAGHLFGPQLHLEMLAAARSGSFYKSHDGAFWFWFLLGTILATLAVLLFKKPWLIFIGCLLSALFLLLLAVVLAYYQVLSPVLIGLAVIAVILLISQVTSLVSEGLRREQLRRQLQRSLSPDVAAAIMAAPNGYLDAARGGKRQVAILFSDIRNFTALSESMEPADIVGQLNEYFAEMTEAVFAHHGTLDKFIGDGVMASWGGVREMTPSEMARSSVLSAQEMLTRLEVLNRRWKEEGRPIFEIGIGIHLGEVIAGEIGSESRSDFTVLGDAVNIASRVESFTRQVGIPLLVSEAIFSELDSGFSPLGEFRLKGRKRAISLYASSVSVPETFQQALAALTKGDTATARPYFEELTATFPLASFYLTQLDSWNGVIEVDEK